MKICATHAGITVGADGASHQTFEDIALMRTIPGMTVICPSDAVSAKKLLRQAVEMDGPCYVRLGRAAVPVYYKEEDEIILGKGGLQRDGKDITIIATGIMVPDAVAAAEALAAEGIDARVIDIHTIKPIDEEIIIKAAEETGAIVTAEEHSIIGGLGDAVAQVVVKNCPVKMAMVGQKDCFGESGQPDELRAKYGMTPTTFEPDRPLTREQLATLLYRYAEYTGKLGTVDQSAWCLRTFPDCSETHNYAKVAMGWAVDNGLIKGVGVNGSTILDPQGYATRAQVAVIIMRFLQMN